MREGRDNKLNHVEGCESICKHDRRQDWSDDYSKIFSNTYSYHKCDVTTTCSFSCITVTTSKYIDTSHKNSNIKHKHQKLLNNDMEKVKEDLYANHVSFSTPQFMSPLMSGHVSGLSTTKAKPLAKICKSRYFHHLLISERDEFMAKLEDARKEQSESEQKAALLIQRLWRIYQKLVIKARVLRHKNMAGIDDRLKQILSLDPRCSDWALTIEQKHHKDKLSAKHIISGALKNRNQKLKALKASQKHHDHLHHHNMEKSGLHIEEAERYSPSELDNTEAKKNHQSMNDSLPDTFQTRKQLPLDHDKATGDSSSGAGLLLQQRVYSGGDIFSSKHRTNGDCNTSSSFHGGGDGAHFLSRRRSSMDKSFKLSLDSSTSSFTIDQSNTSSSGGGGGDHVRKCSISSSRSKLAQALAMKKLESSKEMIEARRLEALATRGSKTKRTLVLQRTGLFSKGVDFKEEDI